MMPMLQVRHHVKLFRIHSKLFILCSDLGVDLGVAPKSTPKIMFFFSSAIYSSVWFIGRIYSLNQTELTHRLCLRHLAYSYCRRYFYEITYFLLTFSKSHIRHISVIVSDMRHVENWEMSLLLTSTCQMLYKNIRFGCLT